MSGKRRTDAELLIEAEQNRRKYREKIATARDPDIRTIRKAQEVLERRVGAFGGNEPLFHGAGIDLQTVAEMLIAVAMGEDVPEPEDVEPNFPPDEPEEPAP